MTSNMYRINEARMQSPSFLTIIEEKPATEEEFIVFWSRYYSDPREHLYNPNIGLPLTKQRLLELFEWKNGGKIAKHKLKSILINYVDNRPNPPTAGDRSEHIRFITSPGGAIWRIFWLHCNAPKKYPIFDQHVYRAMRKLLTGHADEIPAGNHQKAIVYMDDYRPFYYSFLHNDKKKLDEALWSFGKYLKSPYAL